MADKWRDEALMGKEKDEDEECKCGSTCVRCQLMKIETICPRCGGKEINSCVSNDSYGVYDDCECTTCEFSATREDWNHLSKQRQLLVKALDNLNDITDGGCSYSCDDQCDHKVWRALIVEIEEVLK